MKKIFIILFAFFTVSLVSGVVSSRAVWAYDPLGGVCTGNMANTGACSSDKPSTTQGTSLLASIVRIMSYAAGVAAVIMLIIAGLQFITADGDAQNVAGARRAILGAVIGLIVVALAQALLHFVLNRTVPTP